MELILSGMDSEDATVSEQSRYEVALTDIFSTPLVSGSRRGDSLIQPQPVSEVQDQYGRPLVYAKAPKGGVTVQGQFYPGGQFIPAEVLVNATEEERRAVESGSSRQKPLPPEGGVKEPKPVEKGVDFSRLDKIGKKELSKMVSSGRLIEDFEKEFAAAPIEHMLITIPERKGVFPSPASAIHIAGERDRVEIPQMKNLTSATVTHNHPDGANLSLRDLEAMLRTGIKELRAVTPDGTVYSLGVEHSTGYVPEDVIRQVVHEAAKLYADEEDSRKSIKDQAEVYDKIWSHLASKPIQTRVNGYDRSIKFFYKKSGESRGRPLPPEGGVRELSRGKPSVLNNPQTAQKEFLRILKSKYPIAVPMFHEAPIAALDSILKNGLTSGESVEDTNFATIGQPSGFVSSADKLIVKFSVRSRPQELAKIVPDMRYDPSNPAADLLTEHNDAVGADVAYNGPILPGEIDSIYVVKGGQVVDEIKPHMIKR